MSEADPFDCFGDEDDEEETVGCTSQATAGNGEMPSMKRDPTCGILAFHTGTEQALLKHVELELSKQDNVEGGIILELPSFVLNSIDVFSLKRHWMMHVGNEKGETIKSFVQECCSTKPDQHLFTFVELGSYCGYSSILLARTLIEVGRKFHLYSVEVVEQHAQVAREMTFLAGLGDQISILLLDPFKDDLVPLLKSNMAEGAAIDFLFIDHDKSLYLSDLRQLEDSGMIKQGCFVAADNVVFARIDEYRQYMIELAAKGRLRTRLEDGWLEYCEPDFDGDEAKKNLMKDGIELSVYLEDPPFKG